MSKKSQSGSAEESKTEEVQQEKPVEESKENEESKPVEKSKEYRIKETEEDISLDSKKDVNDASPDALKDEIKKEAERSDVFMKYLAPIIVFLLVGGAVSAATWYYAKPERANQKSEEKIQTPPEVKEEPATTPATTQPATPAPTTEKKPASTESNSGRETTYTVKEGDTMSSIANDNGMSSQELATYNGITDVNSLHIGQVLKIPAK